ncbi:hypothetical protein H257_04095 [Aphanomyces astaci]|uniref:Tc1-like transposase DDE domain-containing protein n=1 Tax=Aphanomyces astaci TaxID=112090 RepID=W4GWE0_APHAT|nr:hypothetical protein H257_04095 [Aphanomyces astaci]ETV83344.1 hypothetical protein H257_04095 [Aphanomyces astaci]|eukprot:XP_009826774.1 hypothetical protein H257_04095 [Aphanomyces astaci]
MVDFTNTTRPCSSVASRIKGQSGRNFKHVSVAERLKKIPKTQRTTFRSIAAAMNMSRSTLHAYYKRGIFVKYTSTVRPLLTDANKAVRVQWVMKHLHALSSAQYAFDDMMNTVHVDEKWFFATKISKKMYLAPGEEPPHRTCKSKRYITKVMFLSAVARPRWVDDEVGWFDGKIGTWHFTERVPAERSSRNRAAGTLVTKPVSVTQDIYRKMLIDNVIPAIKAKWPRNSSRCITIQQDNARPHVPPLDARIVEACHSDRWDMSVVYQPPNHPDMNVLDLGFFRAIQSLQEKKNSRLDDDIIAATERAWEDVQMRTLDSNFMTLQACMQEVIKVAGDNCYRMPHMHKAKLAACGRLPDVVLPDCDVVDAGILLLQTTDMEEKVEELAAEISAALDMGEFCSQIERLGVDDELDEDLLEILGLDIE